MNTTPPVSSASNLDKQRLVTALLELELHVHADGWDGPPRLFALGRLGELVATEPELASALGLEGDGRDPDDASLVPIEQEWGSLTGPLDESLAQIMWPPQVAGAAITMERLVLPPAAEEQVAAMSDPQEQLELATNHPERQDMRVAVAVLRDGSHMCAVRARGQDGDTDVLSGPDLVPGLVEALQSTFQTDVEANS
ncbi:MAG: PPA1309 family protein [Candidatus Nanopelagicales bacterium]